MEGERDYRGGTAELLRTDNQPDEEMPPDTQAASRQPVADHEGVPLLDETRASDFRERWETCQRGFVDEPRESVEMADQLVADLIRDLASQFAEERSKLEGQWSRGEEVSTDDLRFSLQRYRSFFNRLLAV